MKNKIAAVLAGTFSFGVLAQAQTVHPPIEAYGELPKFVDAEVSPDGDRIAYVVQSGGAMELRVYDKPDGSIGNRFDVTDLKVRDVRFGDDNHVILQASEATRTAGFIGDYEFSSAIAVNLKNEKVRQLLQRESSLYPAQGGLGYIVGRKPSGELLMPAYIGAPRGDPRYDLMRASPDSGGGRTQALGNEHTTDWFVDSKGNELVRENYDNDRDRYWIEYRDGNRWETFYSVEDTEEIPISILAVADDEKGVYYTGSQEDDDDYSALALMKFDGSIETSLMYKEGADIYNVITNMNRKLIGVRYSGLLPSYEFVDSNIQQSYEFLHAQLPNAMIELDSWSDDRLTILYRIFDGSQSDFWVLHDLDTNKLTLIGYSRDDISKEAVGQVLTVNYPARDGLTIPSIVTVPPGKTLRPGVDLPMIVLPHGGPAAHDTYDFDWMAQYFANRGYLVLQPNFRGSTGFGDAFQDAGKGEWGAKMQDDVTDGVKAMVKDGLADPDRVCIVGASYGGYSALAGGAFTPDLYQCVVAIAPVSDLNKMLFQERVTSGRDHWVISYWTRIMTDGDARREKLDSISPVEYADAFKAPVLLIHGTDDTVVDIDQSRVMKRALENARKRVELVELSGGDHWLSDSETRLATLRALDEFVSRHIAASPAGSADAAE